MKSSIGFAITGSFCTFSKILVEIEKLVNEGYVIKPIFSFNTASMDTRFFSAKDFREKIVELTKTQPVDTIQLAERFGPESNVDVMVVAPCTGNTLSKIAQGITDTPVTMAVKAHLRNGKPVVLGISTNDAMGMNLKNIGLLMPSKNMYFVPFGQDDPVKKPTSLISDYSLLGEAIENALQNKQIQPVLITKNQG